MQYPPEGTIDNAPDAPTVALQDGRILIAGNHPLVLMAGQSVIPVPGMVHPADSGTIISFPSGLPIAA